MKRTFDKTFWITIILSIIFICLVFTLFFWIVLYGYIDCLDYKSNIGNALNGITSPFIALLGVFLTFLAFWVQFKSNVVQRGDITIERYENNFFRLFNIHQDIVAELTITYDNEEPSIKRPETIYKGRDVFDEIYSYTLIEDENGNIYEGLKDIFSKFDISNVKYRQWVSELYTSDEFVQTLDNYFTFTYQVLVYIDKTNVITEKEKHKYTDILRASFNVDELLLLFYHGILINHDLKILIEKYGLLKNLRKEELGNQNVLKLYRDSAYSDINNVSLTNL